MTNKDKPISNPFAGLFWLNKNYTEVLGPMGVQEFHPSDLQKKELVIAPANAHRDYVSIPSKLPRGRVELVRGEIHIYVGNKCPDSIIDKIIGTFHLEDYKDKIKVIRGLHWDKK
jgi:hypothetical protein